MREDFDTGEGELRGDLRLEMKVKNNILWHAIFDLHTSVAAFCRACPQLNGRGTVISNLLRFKESPFNQDGSYRKPCQNIAEATGISASVLFPAELYKKVTVSEQVVEIDSFSALSSAVKQTIAALPAPVETLEEIIDRNTMKERIEKILRTLSYREQEVVKLRFGIGGEEHSLEKVGHILHVTQERVRQIEAKAIRKLQQPSRSGELIGFLD